MKVRIAGRSHNALYQAPVVQVVFNGDGSLSVHHFSVDGVNLKRSNTIWADGGWDIIEIVEPPSPEDMTTTDESRRRQAEQDLKNGPFGGLAESFQELLDLLNGSLVVTEEKDDDVTPE